MSIRRPTRIFLLKRLLTRAVVKEHHTESNNIIPYHHPQPHTNVVHTQKWC